MVRQRGEDDDIEIRPVGPELPGKRVSVHVRHLDIQQNKIDTGSGFLEGKSFAPAGSLLGDHPPAFCLFGENPAVGGIVIDNENVDAAEVGIRNPDGFRRGLLRGKQRYDELKIRALARRTRHPNFSAHDLG